MDAPPLANASSPWLKKAVRVSLEVGLYVILLGLVVWLTGQPFIFPSLGPTALALALRPGEHTAREVLGGHLCGVLAGLLVYTRWRLAWL